MEADGRAFERNQATSALLHCHKVFAKTNTKKDTHTKTLEGYVLVFASVFKKKPTNENIARDCKKCPMSLSVCPFNLLAFVAMFISLISFVGIRKGYLFTLFNDFR